MNDNVEPEIDWDDWLRRWDAQQEGYVPERETRFTAMFDVLAELLPASFTAVDLAAGPGSLSLRLLDRFPDARAIAVDMDPAMLAVGKNALGTVGGRLRWVEVDLASPDWLTALDEPLVDAVLSSTAMHWMWPEPLARLYRELGLLLRPGGVFLNADAMAFGSASPTLALLSQRALDEQWTDEAVAARGAPTAEQWWEAFAAEPSFAGLMEQRDRLFATKQGQESPPDFDAHVAALHDAGFSEVDTIWQVLSDRIHMAVR